MYLKLQQKIIILRTFVDIKAEAAIQAKGYKKSYNIRKFSFIFLEKIFLKNGFNLYFILNKATKSCKKTFYVNGSIKNARNHYICLGIKK